jgi:hypothetical protein
MAYYDIVEKGGKYGDTKNVSWPLPSLCVFARCSYIKQKGVADFSVTP